MKCGAAQDPAVCRQCGQDDAACCKLHPSRHAPIFPLTSQDIQAVEESGRGQETWTTGAIVSTEFRTLMQRLFPGDEKYIESSFPLGGAYRRLKVRRAGACMLLGRRGCQARRDLRPLFCRLFPFWFEGGRLVCLDAPGCRALGRARSQRELLSLLAVDRKTLMPLYLSLRRLWLGVPDCR